MVDLSTRTIKNLFEKQMRELTQRTLTSREEPFNRFLGEHQKSNHFDWIFDCFQGKHQKSNHFDWIFDYQLSGGWIQ